MKKQTDLKQILSAFVVISRILFGLCIVLVFFDLVPLTFNGFGVDSIGRLYVGRGHHIEVWENGELVNSIHKGTSRGHKFTVLENDTILLASGNSVMIMDLEGTTTLEKWEEDHEKTYDELSNQRIFTAVTGEQYRIGRLYGRLTIVQNENVIYQEPLWECIFLWLTFISFPCFFASFIIEKAMKRCNDPYYYPTSRFNFDPRSH